MTSVPTTVSTEDWLGSGKITSFPIPTETQTLSSPSENEEVFPSDAERMLRESSEDEQEEPCTTS